MDIIQKTFKIISDHLELKDNWGNNPYMPKEKFEALLKELQEHVSQTFKTGERHGEMLALSKLSMAHSKFFEDAKKDAGLKDTEIESTSRYLKWLETFGK